MSLELEDIPSWFADYFSINLTTAQLILSAAVICTILLPVMYMTKGRNAVTLWLVFTFLAECIVLGLGWLPFWVMIMTIAVTVLAIALVGARAISG